MAGAGYKLFNTGDVLSASDVNTYLQQQTVMVFASAAARTTALASVLAEGMVSYLKDTDVVEIYTGAAWVSLDDPNAIQNALLTAKGSIVTATAASTPSALAVGANNTVLTADSSTATGLKWATPSSGGGTLSLLSTTTLSGASTTVSISGTYTRLIVEWDSIAVSTNNQVFIELNGIAVKTYAAGTTLLGSTLYSFDSGYPNNLPMNGGQNFYSSSTANKGMAVFENASVSSGVKPFVLFSTGLSTAAGNPRAYSNANGIVDLAAAISSIKFTCSTGSLSGGTVLIYGVS